jgi:hypothetical protein
MPKTQAGGLSRRGLFKITGAVAAATAMLGRFSREGSAHDLTPDDPIYRYDEYEAVVNRRGLTVRQVYEWPNIQNPILFGNVRNGLNGFQFSYGIPASQIQVVVQAYGSANAATYDDEMWEKYQFGQLLNVMDPETEEPAERNIWAKSSIAETDLEEIPEERDDPYYADTSIEGLHRRGVLFLT